MQQTKNSHSLNERERLKKNVTETSHSEENRIHTEDLLDEALTESFPASDSPAIPAPFPLKKEET